MGQRDTFCSFCGTAFGAQGYPRTCGSCGVTIWANPIPVAVALVPVRHEGRLGLLVVRRGIEPQRGKLALVGGFVEEHEPWQVGAAREVREETAIEIDPRTIEPFWYASTEPKPNRILLFSVAAEIDSSAIGPLVANHETMERGLIFGTGGLHEEFAFPLHVEAACRWLVARGLDGPHAFRPV